MATYGSTEGFSHTPGPDNTWHSFIPNFCRSTDLQTVLGLFTSLILIGRPLQILILNFVNNSPLVNFIMIILLVVGGILFFALELNLLPRMILYQLQTDLKLVTTKFGRACGHLVHGFILILIGSFISGAIVVLISVWVIVLVDLTRRSIAMKLDRMTGGARDIITRFNQFDHENKGSIHESRLNEILRVVGAGDLSHYEENLALETIPAIDARIGLLNLLMYLGWPPSGVESRRKWFSLSMFRRNQNPSSPNSGGN